MRINKKVPARKEKANLEKIADGLWSKLVINRDTKCRNCGLKEKLSAHHIRERTHKTTKYDVDNGLCLCWPCHSLQKFRPQVFHDLIVDIIGQGGYDELRARSDITIQDYCGMSYGVKFLRHIIDRLRDAERYEDIPF